MPEPKRVRDDKTGHEYSTYGVYEGMTVLNEPAVDERGELLPPTYPDTAPAANPPAAKKAAATPTDTGRDTKEH
jgi:hypothetical protein